MAKKLIYNGLLGPEIVAFGEAGQFTKGEPVTIDDDLVADQLLAKGYFEEVLPAAEPKAVEIPAAEPKSKKTVTGEV